MEFRLVKDRRSYTLIPLHIQSLSESDPSMPDINLNDMSPDELKQLRKDLDKAIENYDVRRKQDARAAAEAKAREMGFSLSELVDGSAKKGKTPKPAKYRHPENPVPDLERSRPAA